ncbi:hypothetical protein V8E36_008295 [Tilletia maclaganii]
MSCARLLPICNEQASRDNTLKPSLALVPSAQRAVNSVSVASTSHRDHAGIHDAMRYGGMMMMEREAIAPV